MSVNKCNEQYAKLKSVGNAADIADASKMGWNGAKMREALCEIVKRLNSLAEDCAVDPVEIRDIALAALAEPPRNCDIPAKDMDEWCDRFYDYVRRNNPACTRTSPLYTYHDAMKWMLDEANTNKEAK